MAPSIADTSSSGQEIPAISDAARHASRYSAAVAAISRFTLAVIISFFLAALGQYRNTSRSRASLK